MELQPPDIRSVIADGRWFAHRYDEAADATQFRRLDRDDYRRVTFPTSAEMAGRRAGDCARRLRLGGARAGAAA